MLCRRMDRHQISLGLLFLRLIGGGLLIQGRGWIWTAMIGNTRAMLSDPFGVGGEFSWFLDMCGIKNWLRKPFQPLDAIWAIENGISSLQEDFVRV